MNTTFFNITLPGENNRDWMTALNDALSRITENVVRTQLPPGTTLRWGDIAGGKYLEVSSAGVRVVGGLNHGTTPGSNFRIPQGESFPIDFDTGTFFHRTDEDIVYFRSAAGAWIPLDGLSSEAMSALGALLVSDLGADLGSFPVSDGAGGIEHVIPGHYYEILVSDDTTANGWRTASIQDVIGEILNKGQILVGTAPGSPAAFESAAHGTILQGDNTKPSGVQWNSLATILGAYLSLKGQLLGRGATGPVAVDVPTAEAQVLVSDSTVDSGMRWVNQSELGVIPGERTRVAGDLYLYANFF